MTASSRPFPNLPRGKRFVSVTTFRRSGEGVATPMWSGWSSGGIYVVTHGPSGKVKRVRNDLRVSVAACRSQGRVTGPERPGRAFFLEGAERRQAAKAIARRYPVPSFLIEFVMRRRGSGVPAVYFSIVDSSVARS